MNQTAEVVFSGPTDRLGINRPGHACLEITNLDREEAIAYLRLWWGTERLRLEPGCGESLTLVTVEDLPGESVPCPCGNGWLIHYTREEDQIIYCAKGASE